MSIDEIGDGQWTPRDGRIGDRQGRQECRCPRVDRGGCRCEDDGSGAAEVDGAVRR
jgi:hypothetical protein